MDNKIDSRSEISNQPHEHLDYLSKLIRNNILSEIKKKKDIKISTKMFTKTL